MDFEKLFNDLLNDGELNMEDFKKYASDKKELYILKDYGQNDKYYCLKLSEECYNLLDWLLDENILYDVALIPLTELETHEF